MDDINVTLERHSSELSEHERRIGNLERKQDAITKLTLDMAQVFVRLDTLVEKLDKLDRKVEVLEQKPAKRWDGLITALITAAAGVVIGLLLGGGA